ncbi:T9SS type A sorting domain-containing protein [Frigoriflavimonas asaccharolytica]|uniref:Secretion system C-terminal sorting domain-containing protein n=1 Tax=Frigoriflavimonas asaccharolytica TaxID=2735899 RepID=A0A8J8K9D3_9FLAO|nr:T9SS type A sorting domain-containing protein [Frigoriflavimonas asaccharolytica]NRS92957.1 hypothetical protein [Frigoriflavimonas asaccharolytica]
MKKIYLLLLIVFTTLGFAQTYTADFEAETKSSYASADLDIGTPAINWNLTETVIGNLSNDWFNGTKSLRFRGYAASAATMNANKAGGIGTISFSYRQYGTDSQLPYNVDWSSNGTTWTTIGTITATATVQLFSFSLNQANARIRIVAVGGASSNQRMNIDDISITNNGAVGSPTLAANPTSVDFGNQATSTASAATSVSVIGSSLTVVPTYAISGTNASMFSATGTLTVSGGTLNVNFTPTSIGAKTATLTITSGANTSTVSLSGNGVSAGNPYGLNDGAPLNMLMENFESGTANTTANPTGWINVAENGNRTWDTKAFGGNQYAQMSAFSGSGVYKVLLISPAVNLNNINKTNVTFDWNSGFANGATLDVYVIKLVGGVMQKTLLQSINDTTNSSGYGTTFNTVTLNLSAYSGTGFLAFEYNGDAASTTTTYQIDNVNMPTTLGVSDLQNIKNTFVKNTSVTNEINFGAKANVKIFSMNGQLVKSANVSETKSLEVSNLASGMYIVTGIVNGEAVSTKILKK